MTCDDCDTAASRLWHGYLASCDGCMVRALAKSPKHVRDARYIQVRDQEGNDAVKRLQQAVRDEYARLQAQAYGHK